MRRLRSAVNVFAIGIFVALSTATSVSAQPIVSGTYYEESKSVVCSSAECLITFSATPSKIRITDVSCLVYGSSSALLAVSLVVRDTASGPGRRDRYLAFNAPAQATAGSLLYTIDTQVNFVFAAGRYPSIIAGKNSGAGGQMQCKITGNTES